MLLLGFLILASLALFNYLVSGRALFYPPVVFSLVWASVLFLIWLVGDLFYSMSPVTILIFLVGALIFSIGSTIAFLFPHGKGPGPMPVLSDRIISVLVLVVLCGSPLAFRWMFQQISEHPSPNFFVSASLTMLDEGVESTMGYTLFANLVTFSNIVAMMAFYNRKGHRKRWFLAIFLALTLDVLTAGRSGFIGLILALLCLDWLQTRRIRWGLLIGMGAVLLVLSSALAIYLGKGGADSTVSASENAVPVFRGLALYAAGGPVAFDRVVRNPALQPHDNQLDLVFVQILNKFGLRVELPNTSSGFVDLGPGGLVTNVYSIYYTYASLGYLGMMVMIALLGFGITLCWRSAVLGNRVAAIMYAFLFGGLVLSPFAELFFIGLNYLLKTLVISWLVYSFPTAWYRGTQFVRRCVARDLAISEIEPAG